MSKLGTVNNAAVISVNRTVWKPEDDQTVKALCDARALVLTDGGGAFEAVVIGDTAIIWERNGRRFRAFPVGERDAAIHHPAWNVTLPVERGLLVLTYDETERAKLCVPGVVTSLIDNGDVVALGDATFGTVVAGIKRDSLRALRRTLAGWPL